jgi:hypothetical protein
LAQGKGNVAHVATRLPPDPFDSVEQKTCIGEGTGYSSAEETGVLVLSVFRGFSRGYQARVSSKTVSVYLPRSPGRVHSGAPFGFDRLHRTDEA